MSDKTASEKAVEAAQHIEAERRDSAKPHESIGTIVLAGTGKRVDISAFHVDHDYIPSSGKSFYGDAVRHIKEPLPGAMYVWAGISGLHKKSTISKIRAKQYRPIEETELIEDSDLPFDAHKLLIRSDREVNAVCIHDLILCEVHPKAVRELYWNREAEAALKASDDAILNYSKQNYKGSDVVERLADLPDQSMVKMALTGKAKTHDPNKF